ncbi:MAG TPA: sugar kinase [Micropepsaceae bacterium]|jgi:sugar/nucleoside kinase (ribokinase family)
MQALFIGQTYIDVTFIADRIPTGDEKDVAHDYAISFGGNAVTAAFCCARLGIAPDLLTSLADDWLGRMFLDMAAKYQISVHARKVRRSSLSFVMPKDGKRAILRLRDDNYLHPFPPLNLEGCRALHLDGHQGDGALHYARACRQAGIFTSLDGGGLRSNTMELLPFIDAAVVSERFCEQLQRPPADVLDLLKQKGCRIGAVTLGERGLLWFDERGQVAIMPALAVPPGKIVDTNGAGDVFHGAYVYSRMMNPDAAWEAHFRFARAASAHAICHLGNEARLPTLADLEEVDRLYQPGAAATA